jgi:heme A synthase
LWAIWKSSTGRNRFSRSAIALFILLFVQVGIGMTNVLFLAPVGLQIAHLSVADALWILLVLASADLVLEPAQEGRTT